MMSSRHLYRMNQGESAVDIINPDIIKRALQDRFQLTYHSSPLENLCAIDDILSNRLFMNGTYGRRCALWELLTEIITHQLSKYRSSMGICHQPYDATRKQAFEAIQQDAHTENRHLIAWSWLYYGYIRIDLNITQNVYARESHFDNRTIRRYQQSAFLAIVEILVQRESAARRSRVFAPPAVITNLIS